MPILLQVLTALIFIYFGTGPIKGFATTLLIGIGTSLFTAIFITRILVDSDVMYKGRVSLFNKMQLKDSLLI